MKLIDEKLQSITSEPIGWIREMMRATGGSREVLGISGGKDSSVAAALYKELWVEKTYWACRCPTES
jgi:NH3-dependent NAD+ synthetase